MGVPNRLSGTLPVSIAAHAAVICILVVIPLTAQISLPMLPSAVDAYIRAVPAPAPPPPVVRAAATVPRPSQAPTEAPLAIVPERPPASSEPPEGAAGAVDFGAPAAVGSPTGDVLLPGPPVPPAAPNPPRPVTVGELVRAPQKTLDIRPVYPEIARAARVQGTVVLEAVLDRNGLVEQVRVLKSVPLLDRAAVDAVSQWRYTPSTLHGVPVEVLMTITVTFNLQQ